MYTHRRGHHTYNNLSLKSNQGLFMVNENMPNFFLFLCVNNKDDNIHKEQSSWIWKEEKASMTEKVSITDRHADIISWKIYAQQT